MHRRWVSECQAPCLTVCGVVLSYWLPDEVFLQGWLIKCLWPPFSDNRIQEGLAVAQAGADQLEVDFCSPAGFCLSEERSSCEVKQQKYIFGIAG